MHIGATVAAAISQGKSSSLKFDSGILKFFRTDNEKRLFISCGASAGNHTTPRSHTRHGHGESTACPTTAWRQLSFL